MPRYFIAIPIPSEARHHFIAAQPPRIPGIRLVDGDELHLTLHFLGDVSPDQEEAIRNALESIRASRFSITVRGTGQFPPEGEPTVFWAGVKGDEPLLALRALIGLALRDAIGFQAEPRPYTPHITLAHVNSSVPLALSNEFLKANRDLHLSYIVVDRFALYASVGTEMVPRYREVALFRLT